MDIEVLHVYNEILLSQKKDEIMPFATTRMQPEIITLSEVSQKETGSHHMIPLICGIQNMTQMNLCMKQKQIHRHRK